MAKLMETKVDVVVVGDSSVGKTCLLLRYTDDIFIGNMKSTIGECIMTGLL